MILELLKDIPFIFVGLNCILFSFDRLSLTRAKKRFLFRLINSTELEKWMTRETFAQPEPKPIPWYPYSMWIQPLPAPAWPRPRSSFQVPTSQLTMCWAAVCTGWQDGYSHYPAKPGSAAVIRFFYCIMYSITQRISCNKTAPAWSGSARNLAPPFTPSIPISGRSLRIPTGHRQTQVLSYAGHKLSEKIDKIGKWKKYKLYFARFCCVFQPVVGWDQIF